MPLSAPAALGDWIGDKATVGAGGGRVGIEVDLDQSALHASPRCLDRVGASLAALEDHEAAVRFFGVAVELDDPLQDGLARGRGCQGFLRVRPDGGERRGAA
jgi:hypothetical protein